MVSHSYRDGHYEVVHLEVPVLVSPSTEALKIGCVRKGKHVCGDTYSIGGKPWLCLDDGSVKELVNEGTLDHHKHSGSAFILIRGGTVSVGELLQWMGPPDMSLSPCQEASASAVTCRAEASSPSTVQTRPDAQTVPAGLDLDSIVLSLEETW